MPLAPTETTLCRIGSERINSRRVPVFVTPDGERVVSTIDSTGTRQFVDAEGAVLLKNGPYPLCTEVSVVFREEMRRSVIPFRFRTTKERDDSSHKVMHALVGRMIVVRQDEKSFLAAA